MEKKLLEIIKRNKLLKKGDRVCVAVSGGADSVALLMLLNNLKNELGISLYVVHVNHHIRGLEGDQDMLFVESFAKQIGVKAETIHVDAVKYSKDNKYTLEQGARILRYKEIYRLMEEKSLTKLALAHHKNDQAETVLMHLFRGSGLSGLVGMEMSNGKIIRPLLEFEKNELEDYLLGKNIGWQEDSTNKETKYTRNYIRREILPRVEEVYSGATSNIARLSARIKRENDYLDSLASDDYLDVRDGLIVIKKEAFLLHEVLKERLVKKALNILNASVDVFETHYNSVIKLMSNSIGKKLNLPHGLLVYKDYKGVCIEKSDSFKFENRKFNPRDCFQTPLGEIKVNKEVSFALKEQNGLIADMDMIPSDAIWRKIQPGDRFTKFGGGTKPIKDYLVNKKIGTETRKKMVVLAENSGEIFIIPGVEISDKVKITNNTNGAIRVWLKN